MITRKIPLYHYKTTAFSEIETAEFLSAPFVVEFDLPQAPREEKTLFSAPGALVIRLINRSYDSETEDMENLRRENCFYFNETNEWILEALCTMVNDTAGSVATFALRLPLSAPFANGRIGLAFDGTWLRYLKDGECLTENSGFDRFATPTEITVDADFANARVARIENCDVSYREYTEECDVGFYMPLGWDTNVGDVMNFYHDGTYHLLYLYDRRHHRSRNGNGAHYIKQITSRDLIHWEEQPTTAEIRAPWESHGTGTMLFHKGKYYLSYGLHSERHAQNSADKMGSASFDPETGAWSAVSFEEIQKRGQLPTGATYAESDDGIHFTPSDRIFHLGRNPSAYEKDGKVIVYSGYVSNVPAAESNAAYISDGFGLPFTPTPCPSCFQKDPPMKHTTECPSLFEFGGYRYAILGFTGYYRTLSPESEQYVDVGLAGETLYDGLCVPMVAPFGKDRRLISGWIGCKGWGSMAVHRELILEENGVLGMKWVPELIPSVKEENFLKNTDLSKENVAIPHKESYLLSMTVTPNDASKLGLVFRDENGHGLELRLDFEKSRAQIADAVTDGFAPEIPAMHEVLPHLAKGEKFRESPRHSQNFTLPNVTCMKEPFDLRILCRYSRRQRATVIDAEIAGRRTLISARKETYPTMLSVLKQGNAEVSEVNLSRLSVKHD